MSEWQTVSEGGDAWDQEKPIQGIYQSMKTGVGPNDSNMYMIKVGDELTGIWGSTVLDSKFEQITKGSEVRVEYLGKTKSKTGTEYKDYKVQYKPTEASKVEDTFEGSEVI